jgi:hypothetical protein
MPNGSEAYCDFRKACDHQRPSLTEPAVSWLRPTQEPPFQNVAPPPTVPSSGLSAVLEIERGLQAAAQVFVALEAEAATAHVEQLGAGRVLRLATHLGLDEAEHRHRRLGPDGVAEQANAATPTSHIGSHQKLSPG